MARTPSTTTSVTLPPTATSPRPVERAAAPSPFPLGMRSTSTTYTSLARSNMRVHIKKSCPFRTSIRDWETPTPDDSYSESGESFRNRGGGGEGGSGTTATSRITTPYAHSKQRQITALLALITPARGIMTPWTNASSWRL